MNNVIWQFWTGENQMSQNRISALNTNINLGVQTKLVKTEELEKMQVDGHPFHPAYYFLSYTHRADYLRCYFMHFYGGGYADIKFYSNENNWKECFQLIEKDEKIWAIGQKEHMGGSPIKNFNTQEICDKLISNGYFIMRPKTEFTKKWFDLVNEKLDSGIDKLKTCWKETKLNPQISKQKNPKYPFRWAELLGEILHQLEYEYRNTGRILTTLNSGRIYCDYR